MGCDIHLYIERKVNDKWEKVDLNDSLLPHDRDYELFAFLAGVRGRPSEMDPLFEDRGLPDDTSATRDDSVYLGEHNFTHAYLDEILSAPWNKAGLDKNYFIIFFEYVLPRILGLLSISAQQKRGIRVIMGFDS